LVDIDFSGEQKEVWTMAVLCKQTAIQILSRQFNRAEY